MSVFSLAGPKNETLVAFPDCTKYLSVKKIKSMFKNQKKDMQGDILGNKKKKKKKRIVPLCSHISTSMKRPEEKLSGDYRKMLCIVLN